MKQLVILIACLFLLFTSCEEDSCDDKIVPQIELSIQVHITVIDGSGNYISQYPVRSIIQKTFCDENLGFPIEETGVTSESGIFSGEMWTLPYVNSDDYVTVYFYAGVGDNELGASKKINYTSAKYLTGKGYAESASHVFTIN